MESGILGEADAKENGARMTRKIGKLPVVLKISALSVGSPLVVLGMGSIFSDLAEILRVHSFTAAPHFGLELGPVFAVVGLSFLWPLRPIESPDR